MLNFTQALNDHGVDLILEFQDRVKIGFQIKSHFNVKEAEFAAKVKRQFAESFAHGLDKWFLSYLPPLNDGITNFEPKISHLINEMSMFKTNCFAILNPLHTAALFQKLIYIDQTAFNLEYQLFANEPCSKEDVLRVIQGLLSGDDQTIAHCYLASRRTFTAKPPISLNRMNQVLEWNFTPAELMPMIADHTLYLEKLNSLTQPSREFMTGILERAEETSHDKMRALCRDVENHLGISGKVAKKEIEILEQ